MHTDKMDFCEQEREQIINDSLPFIKYTARRLSRRLPAQLSMNDLISVGIVGLLDALTRYTEGRVKQKTFVEYRIRGAMLDELRSQDWVPRSLREKISEVRKTHRMLEQELGRKPAEEEVASTLSMSLDDYYRTMQAANDAVVFSFEDFRNPGHEDGDLDVMECLGDPAAKTPLQRLEEMSDRENLARLIDALPEREKLVLSLYYWEELTMKEIGKVTGLSEGRICQIHNQTLSRLKAEMTALLVP